MTPIDQPLTEAIETLGALLGERGLHYELVAIGGGSLMLLGLIQRPTKDIDVVAVIRQGKYEKADPLPRSLLEASAEVAVTLGLRSDWLNAGPTDLLQFGLPEGFENRVQVRTHGGLTLHIASRLDQIHFKLYAAVDQGPRSKHFADLKQLQPTPNELLASARWARTHDPSPGFGDTLRAVLKGLGVQDAEI